jgi:hypothetical protein
VDQALRALEAPQVDVVLAAELHDHGFTALAAAVHTKQNQGRHIRAVGLAREDVGSLPAGFAECLVAPDRETMLASLARLAAAVTVERVADAVAKEKV